MKESGESRWRRGLRWSGRIAAACGLLGSVFGVVVLVDGWRALGRGAEGARLERMERSPQRAGGVFENPQPLWNDVLGSMTAIVDASDYGTPVDPLPVVVRGPGSFDAAPVGGLRVTWLGHSTILIEIDGVRILTDPVWGERTSPVDWLGPKRWYAPPVALSDLPPIDVVLISHDHYDHLDQPTIEAIKGWRSTFIAPLGVGAHLSYWGVPEAQIVEMDWWERVTVGAVEVVCAPSRHASGRQILDQNATLWAGYALLGPERRVFFSGDTGLFPGMKEIGERLGPFDLTMIEVGAYHKAWPDWHIGPEQAVLAHQHLRGGVMMPIHWGLFNLAMHGWTEPVERTVAAAEAAGVALITPRPGQSVDLEKPFNGEGLRGKAAKVERWWPEVPWESAEEHPIRSTGLE